VIVAGGVPFVLDVRTFKLSEFSPTGDVVIMVPAFAPPGVVTELQSQTPGAAGVYLVDVFGFDPSASSVTPVASAN
jgi:hypothetical protein